MAVDEALAEAVGAGLSPQVVRLYGFSPPTLSLGRFQRIKGRYFPERLSQDGITLVRRPTGGHAVLHDDELTYSVILSKALISEQLGDSRKRTVYDFIARTLLAGLGKPGNPGEDQFLPPGRPAKPGLLSVRRGVRDHRGGRPQAHRQRADDHAHRHSPAWIHPDVQPGAACLSLPGRGGAGGFARAFLPERAGGTLPFLRRGPLLLCRGNPRMPPGTRSRPCCRRKRQRPAASLQTSTRVTHGTSRSESFRGGRSPGGRVRRIMGPRFFRPRFALRGCVPPRGSHER